MELQNRAGFAHKSMDVEEQNFTIRASAKAFQILSSQLYTNKPRAIIRELLCNAWDAHTVAGNAYETIELQLPNSLEPTFRIRDFGTGISPEDILHVYTKYFESTKTHSNDYIGGLGLGSKTPFCYTDNFIVNSYYGGYKYCYACILNEEGMPAINLIDKEETKEPNGLEVSFAVKQSDHAVFKKEAEFVLFWFAKMPTVKGSNLSIKKMNTLMSGAGWCVVEEERKQGGSYYYNYGNDETSIKGAWILMGNVAYRLDKTSFTQLTPEQSVILGLDIHIECPIGSVEIAASREQLSLNKSTINYIKKRLSEIAVEARGSFEKDLDSCKNRWEATLSRVEKSSKLNANLQQIVNAGQVQWKGQKLPNRIEAVTESFTVYDREVNSSGDVISRKTTDRWVEPRREVAFVKVPVDWKEGKVRAWCRRNDKNFTKVVILETSDQKNLATEFEISDEYLFKLEDLPEPVKVVGARSAATGKKKGDVYVYNFDADFPRKFQKIVSIDFEDENEERIYVKSRYKEPEIGNCTLPLNTVQSAVYVFNENWKSKEITEIYGLTETQIELVKENDAWISLDDYMLTEIKKALSNPKLIDFLAAEQNVYLKQHLLICDSLNRSTVFGEMVKTLDPTTHPICKFLERVEVEVRDVIAAKKLNLKNEIQALGNYDINRVVPTLKNEFGCVSQAANTKAQNVVKELIAEEDKLFKKYAILSLFATPRVITHTPADLAKVLRSVF